MHTGLQRQYGRCFVIRQTVQTQTCDSGRVTLPYRNCCLTHAKRVLPLVSCPQGLHEVGTRASLFLSLAGLRGALSLIMVQSVVTIAYAKPEDKVRL